MKKFLTSKIFRFVWSVAIAVLIYFICPKCFSKSILISLLIVEIILINAAPFFSKINWLIQSARILVGGLFIFSGFIKANDPVGFSYKLQEYFEVFTADTGLSLFTWISQASLPLAVILCASEIILGLMLLIGFKSNLTLALLFAQIAFFTFLTFYSACFNKVTTCGCFGDFLVLKPWTSFWKDVVLMILITLLIAGKNNINNIFNPMYVNTLFTLGLIFSVWFPIYAIRNLPPIDFRAYKIGNNIKEKMTPGPNYKEAVFATTFTYKNLKTGEEKILLQDDYMKSKIWEDTLSWKFDTMMTKTIKEAVDAPKITDFKINTLDGNDITDSLLNDKNYSLWFIAYDISNINQSISTISKMNDIYQLAVKDGKNVYGMSASGAKEIDSFKHQNNCLIDFVMVDATVLKTMIRSNPGLMLMKKGTVIMNWHYNNFPTYSEIKKNFMK
ncbi:MAG: DoxX family membrane protein [Bacteroidetes bacterium]|nr:DoxX family membrane protein [Bacteroidota bacterium]